MPRSGRQEVVESPWPGHLALPTVPAFLPFRKVLLRSVVAKSRFWRMHLKFEIGFLKNSQDNENLGEGAVVLFGFHPGSHCVAVSFWAVLGLTL